MDELIENFSLERIGKAGTKFDIDKAKWFNQEYLRRRSNEELASVLIGHASNENINVPKDVATEIVALMKERAVFPIDLWEQARFFFVLPQEYDQKIKEKKWTKEASLVVQTFLEKLDECSVFVAEEIKKLIVQICEDLEIGLGKVMPGFRLALTGGGTGPDLMRIMEILGKEEVELRLRKALKEL